MTAPATTTLLHGRADLAVARAAALGPVGVVMTLGALHEGHAALLRTAREQAATVLTTIFVNPLQFGPGEDFDKYPRPLEADLDLCRELGTDLVFAPSAADMYPNGEPLVRVDPGPAGRLLEGASRPGHFAGVLTVVLKLLQLTRADLAFFGEKDYQQLTLVRTMVRDLDLPVRVVTVPTVRDSDGVARSSRNRYLSPAERAAARSLPAALAAGAGAAARGAAPAAVLAAARQALAGVDLDYLALTDPALRPLTDPVGTDAGAVVEVPADGVARLLVAARAGATRLIDNAGIQLSRGDM
jgi:pantoate--beta-alanine ligase